MSSRRPHQNVVQLLLLAPNIYSSTTIIPIPTPVITQDACRNQPAVQPDQAHQCLAGAHEEGCANLARTSCPAQTNIPQARSASKSHATRTKSSSGATRLRRICPTYCKSRTSSSTYQRAKSHQKPISKRPSRRNHSKISSPTYWIMASCK
jgi:hypothetical protein